MVFLVVTLPVCFAVQYDLTYDANGNLVTGDGKYRVYNSFNQLWKVYNGSNGSGVLLQEYAYHPLEERVWMKKTYNSSGNLTETVYYWTKNFVTVVNLSGTYNFTYVYHNGELIAQSVNGVKTFFHNDIKGSVVAVSN
ncbi:hypothetical protein JW756_06875, partial [Candidatus Woesearchaeota archaeon]|nr:hypothetical protein [Candidatus Woesearchaeota archaeon]